MNEQIFTIREVAAYLKMSKSKVYHLAQTGKIPIIKIGRNVRVRETELKEWLNRHTTLEKIPF